MKRLLSIVAGAVAFCGMSACSAPLPPTDVSLGDLPPIDPAYRAAIVAWSRTFFAQPASLHSVSVSDPVLTRDTHGRLLWLVCFEAGARASDGRDLGPEREAFGFAPNYVSAPLDRRGSSLSRQDCDIRPLVWRPWPRFPMLSARETPRRARHR